MKIYKLILPNTVWLPIVLTIYIYAITVINLKYVAATSFEKKEAYFNGSSYIRLLTPMSIWSHSGISFRTCRGGEIFTQQYNRYTLWMDLRPEFVQITLTGASLNPLAEAKISENLVDNKWHTIEFLYKFGSLNLIVDKKAVVIANSTYNSAFLTNKDVGNDAAILILGKTYSGCLLHGPGLIFNTSAMHAQGVVFGQCPLANGPCGDHDILVKIPIDHCANDPCLQHGVCISLVDTYECHCTSRYTGKNCQKDLGDPCLPNPCLNNGICNEDILGNYKCSCLPNYSGPHCKTEVNVHPLCEKSPCLNNGTCQVLSNGKDVKCECINGFHGAICELEWNECEPQPCQNNGRCIDEIGNFACDCSNTGFSGEVCDQNVDECIDKSPCLNGGICFDTYGSYICDCAIGFGGSNCEQTINECQHQPCLNGGICSDKSGSFKCTCIPGFSGIFCEIGPPCPQCPIDSECIGGKCVCKPGTTGPIGHCLVIPITSQPKASYMSACSSICFNGATCLGNESNSTCICAEGFTGLRCENLLSKTTENNCICSNGGTCSFDGNFCHCPPGFEGTHCEKLEPCSSNNCKSPMTCFGGKCICPENTNCIPCNSNPCHNGGSCKNQGTKYECECTEGWNGTNCEIDIDECAQPRPCNNGICVNSNGSFKCYCTPGYTGLRCDSDVDECLSMPCKNGATCSNKVNDFECHCLPGFTEKDCSVNIDECANNPCAKGSKCNDMINNFTCTCIPGMTGRLCDIDIDDCESQPCQHNGRCIDELGKFHCDCSLTGYTGEVCEMNIDECQSNPCINGASCADKVNDYQCNCFQGYTGKNCEVDINECETNPCQYNGICLEKSNFTLYSMAEKQHLPTTFSQIFSYENASGYECICVPGVVGKNCEININECDSNPCTKHGTCNDGIGNYTCECEPGYEGVHCENDIDECAKLMPCVNGTCVDRIDDYDCDCDSMFGGKNCSVELIGCASHPCLNGGDCKPYLANETKHLFNCTCQHGFQGSVCEKVTTMSLVRSTLIAVNTSREEGYDINLEFKTTLPNGILAFGKAVANSYILELINGRLNLHSSLLNKWEGVFIGSGLNDSNWQKVFVAINSSHLVLAANQEQTIYPINSYESTNGSHPSFPTTYLGGTIPNLSSYLRHLTHQPSSFVGCMQDVVINGKWIFPNEPIEETSLVNIQSGCPRKEQCKPNPCYSNGQCQDLWHTFSCSCQRPHLGRTCKYNLTAATFGHENTTHSAVFVETTETARRAIRSILDISMFIRTRQPSGHIFYLGSATNTSGFSNDIGDSYVFAKLHGGELLVKMQFNGTPEAYTVGGNKLDNGYNHLIQVVRNQTLVQVKVNGTEYFRKTLSSTGQLDAQLLYLGGPAPTIDESETNLSKEEIDKLYFKGIIQDVQISNGSYAMTVQLYPLNEDNLIVPPPFGPVSIDNTSVLRGEVSDDLCRKMPCQHGAICKNTWNDFTCICPKGYKGKLCQDIQFCELNKCPGNAVCQNLDDGFECLTNMTFQGNEENALAFAFFPKYNVDTNIEYSIKPTVEISYRTKTGGTLFYVQDGEKYFEIAVIMDQVTVQWRLTPDLPETKRFKSDKENIGWNKIFLRCQDGKLETGWKGWEDMIDPSPVFSVKIDQHAFNDLLSGKHLIYLGGMPLPEKNAISKTPDSGAIFKGCLGEARVGNFLLPYFEHSEMYSENIQPRSQFRLNSTKPDEGCILCFQHDCKNKGYCSNPSEKYACDCLPGYEGDDCSKDIDECLNSTCVNNSTCVDEIAHYTCSCLPGYEGEFCQDEIDECASMPCHNGGTCTDMIAEFNCLCTDKYMGLQCDVLKQVTCENNLCQSGSTCIDGFNSTTGNNFTCLCIPGMQGDFCEKAFCDADAEPCQNGGFCLKTEPTSPICQCSIGYEGKYCQNDINECESMPCQNNGQCEDLVGKFECNCSGTGFEGLVCENDIDECMTRSINCGGRGYCINTRGSFKCQCAEGLCGTQCNHEDLCVQADICLNGGECIETCEDYADYKCNCSEHFTGKNCSDPILLENDGPSPTDVALIVVPIVLVLIIAGGALLSAFIVMARNKRATRGTYSPSAQEYCNPRLEMDNVLKPPPEERLI